MEILKGFVCILIGMILLDVADNIRTLVATVTQYLVSCVNVKVSQKNVKLTKLEILMNNLQNFESHVVGYEVPNESDEYYYDEDEDDYEDQLKIKPKQKLGF